MARKGSVWVSGWPWLALSASRMSRLIRTHLARASPVVGTRLGAVSAPGGSGRSGPTSASSMVILLISSSQRLREKEDSSEDPAPADNSAAQSRQRSVRRRTQPGMAHLPELYPLSDTPQRP